MNFYSCISKYYNEIFPLNKSQISFVRSYLNVTKKDKKLLDIGCGTGGLPIGLYNDFKTISAIDTNAEMLELAKNNAGGKNINFRNMNMLDIATQFPKTDFDIVLCFGNTVVHLQNIKEVEKFFGEVKIVLKQGGKFLFQIINYDNILDNNLGGLPTIENELIKFERHYSLDENNLIDFSTILTIKTTGEVLNNNAKLFPVRKNKVENALKNAGFETVKSFSSFTKNEYNPSSLPLVFECQ